MRIVEPEKINCIFQKRTTGQQIKSVAELLCFIGWIASIFYGMVFIGNQSIFAVIIAAIGCYASWATTRFLVGFGDLIDETAANRENTDRIIDILESRSNVDYETESNSATEESL